MLTYTTDLQIIMHELGIELYYNIQYRYDRKTLYDGNKLNTFTVCAPHCIQFAS